MNKSKFTRHTKLNNLLFSQNMMPLGWSTSHTLEQYELAQVILWKKATNIDRIRRVQKSNWALQKYFSALQHLICTQDREICSTTMQKLRNAIQKYKAYHPDLLFRYSSFSTQWSLQYFGASKSSSSYKMVKGTCFGETMHFSYMLKSQSLHREL